jgi:hypothetical protein
MPDVQVAPHVLALTDRGIQCATPAAPTAPFWLPRSSCVRWVYPPEPGALCGGHSLLAGRQAQAVSRRCCVRTLQTRTSDSEGKRND